MNGLDLRNREKAPLLAVETIYGRTGSYFGVDEIVNVLDGLWK